MPELHPKRRIRFRLKRICSSSAVKLSDEPGTPQVHPEGAHVDPLNRLDHEVRKIILRDPVPKIGRKQKRLIPPAIHESAHRRILTEHHPKVRQTDSSLSCVDAPVCGRPR